MQRLAFQFNALNLEQLVIAINKFKDQLADGITQS
jgi:hypothetical protein